MGVTAHAVLFDVDGTLVDEAELAAFATVAAEQLDMPAEFAFAGGALHLNGREIAGYVDAQVWRELCRQAGVADDPDCIAALITAYTRAYEAELAAGTAPGTLLPGAAELLYALAGAAIPVALVTGNASGVARAKLQALGVAGHFVFDPDAGFGDHCRGRGQLPGAALARLGIDRHDGPVLLVGDTAADMRSAASNWLYGIGVTSGTSNRDALLANGAHAAVDSLFEVLAVLEPDALAALVRVPRCGLCGLPREDPCRDCGGTALAPGQAARGVSRRP